MYGPWFSHIKPATIQRARVLDVNSKNFTLTCATEFTKKPLTWVSWATPYQHYENGEGIYFMPEIGSICWLCEPSDHSMPFVIGWASIEDEYASHRGRKWELNPGDIYLGTRDENAIVLRRGGVIQIGATPLAQRFYIPIDNIIRDLCENYSLHTLGGSLEWTVRLPEDNKEGKLETKLVLQAKEFADDPKPIAQLQIGSHGEQDPTILSLVLSDSGGDSPKPRISIQLAKTGDLTGKIEKGDNPAKVSWDIQGSLSLVLDDEVIIRSRNKKVSIFAKQLVEVQAEGFDFKTTKEAGTVHTAKGLSVTSSAKPAIKAGQATYPVLLLTPDTIAWLTGHLHQCAAPGTPSGPPVLPKPLIIATVQSQDIKTS
jgi:hypothetical protein